MAHRREIRTWLTAARYEVAWPYVGFKDEKGKVI